MASTESPFNIDREELHSLCQHYLTTMLAYKRHEAGLLIQQAYESGVSLADIYLHVMQPALYKVGELWQCQRISVGDEHFFSNATQSIMAQLSEKIPAQQAGARKLIAATPQREQHQLGLRMVCDLLELDGWDAFFLGANTPGQSLMQVVQHRQPELVALSVTMSEHIPFATEAVELLRSLELPNPPRIIIGGRAFAQDINPWQQTHVDGYAPDAGEALNVVRQWFAVC